MIIHKRKTIALLGLIIAFFINRTHANDSIHERPLVIIVPSYNNAAWYQKNLDSIFMQDYSNYRVIYIDDCSSDGTYEYVKEYVEKRNVADRMLLIGNTERKRALENIYNAMYRCADHEIAIIIDGDDWLAHEYVFTQINEAYNMHDIWFTHAQYIHYPTNKPGLSREIPRQVIQENSYRKYKWVTYHLYSFYVWLFKQIKKEDLMYNGAFFSCTYDRAIVYPMLEMAGDKFHFIPDVLYVYNRANPINVNKIELELQRKCSRIIRGKKPYNPLEKPAFGINLK